MTKNLNLSTLFLLIAPPLFWAGNFVVGRIVRDDIGPMSLSFWRWVIAFCCLLPFTYKYIKRDWPLYRQHLGFVLKTSIVGVTSFNTLIYLGLHGTTATNALLLNSTIPVLIILFGVIFYKHRLYTLPTIGLILSLIGVGAIILNGDINALLTFSFNASDLIIFTAMICWAIYTLWMKNTPDGMNRTALTCVQIAIAVIALLPLWLWESGGQLPIHLNNNAKMALLYVGIFPSVIAYVSYSVAISRVGPMVSGLFIHLMPVFGVILAAIFANESIQLYHIFGIALIALGLVLSSRQS
ncbi:MAG: DMT family transporter [Alcaligenaceae bacterium]|nr:DMT family transporter [Alcaligenaceae bacterium]